MSSSSGGSQPESEFIPNFSPLPKNLLEKFRYKKPCYADVISKSRKDEGMNQEINDNNESDHYQTSKVKKSSSFTKNTILLSDDDDDDDEIQNGQIEDSPIIISKPDKRKKFNFSSDSDHDDSPNQSREWLGKPRLNTQSTTSTKDKRKRKAVVESDSDDSDGDSLEEMTGKSLVKDQLDQLKSLRQHKQPQIQEPAKKKTKTKRATICDDSSDDDLSPNTSTSNLEQLENEDPIQLAKAAKKAKLKKLKDQCVAFFNCAGRSDLLSLPRSKSKVCNAIMENRPFRDYDHLTDVSLVRTLAINYLYDLKDKGCLEDLLQECNERAERLQKSAQYESTDSGFVRKLKLLNNKRLQLKPYQEIGVNWLILMRSQEMNAVLADEMGLGKTVQVIAFLAYLKEIGQAGRNLIVVPSSTIDNWLSELKRWCPKLRVLAYYGSQEERTSIRSMVYRKKDDLDVLLTTYHMLRAGSEDMTFFKKSKLNYVIYDEAHMLKNCKTQRYVTLMRIKSKQKLLLTGTPLQNNLVELISLLHFVMPDLFIKHVEDIRPLLDLFDKKSSSVTELESKKIDEAKQILKPFVLRRLKSEVLSQLPCKTERIYRCCMSVSQNDLYKSVLAKYTGKDGVMEGLRGCNVLMELRKAANHPLLHRRLYTDHKLHVMAERLIQSSAYSDSDQTAVFEDMQVMSDFELWNLCKKNKVLHSCRLSGSSLMDSGKLSKLEQILTESKSAGEKVLLFSQFVVVLDILEAFLNKKGHSFLRLDGSVKVVERQSLIDQFNTDSDSFIFLLSTRAGGLGINLTAASMIILHDIDFNPHNDRQAEDRCHRVGQTREVTVIKLISEGTVEEAMLDCAQQKLQLEQKVTGDTHVGDQESKTVEFLLNKAFDSVS